MSDEWLQCSIGKVARLFVISGVYLPTNFLDKVRSEIYYRTRTPVRYRNEIKENGRMFTKSELSVYASIKKRRQAMPPLIEVTVDAYPTGNRIFWWLWKKEVVKHLYNSKENGTQTELEEFLQGVNAILRAGFATRDELSALLKRNARED